MLQSSWKGEVCKIFSKCSIKWQHKNISHQNNHRILMKKLPQLSCLWTLFSLPSLIFTPVCAALHVDLGWRMVTRCSVQEEGTGPATHTLYIDTTPGTWTPQSDTTHTLDKVGILTILTIFLGQITSGDLKWNSGRCRETPALNQILFDLAGH